MYYKSILQILKDPSSNENTRLKIIDEAINDDKHICHLYLILMKQHYLAKKAELLLMNVMLIIKHM